MSAEAKNPDAEDYLCLLNEHERSIAAYVHSLVSNIADAEDILQSCKIVMWKQFGNFETGTNFLAWARKIALHQILNFRRSEKRRDQYSTDPGFIEAVAREIDKQMTEPDHRSDALRFCLSKLPEAHRRLVLLRYYEDRDISEIAALTKRSEAAVYRLLSRVRVALNECISQTIPSAS